MSAREKTQGASASRIRLAFADLLRPTPGKLIENSLPTWEGLRPGLFVIDCSRIRFHNAAVARALVEFSRRVAQVAPTSLVGLSPAGEALLRLLSVDLVLSLETPAAPEP
jgi:anti-anti-sigma regulatory factor